MYGVKARLPLDIEADESVANDETSEQDVISRVAHLAETCVKMREEGLKNIKSAQAKQKERYDVKHQGENYKVGDRVLKYNRRRDGRMGDSLAARFTGPFTIYEVTGKGCYRIMDGDRIMKQIVNAVNLKLFVEPCSPSGRSRVEIPATTPSPKSIDISKMTTPSTPSVQPATTPSPKSIDITKMTTPTTPSVQPWLPEYHLTEVEKQIIQEGEWVNDRIVDAINNIASKVLGTEAQTSLLVQGAGGFQPTTAESVRILYDEHHWIACGFFDNTIYSYSRQFK
jgi:hypothetical protein